MWLTFSLWISSCRTVLKEPGEGRCVRSVCCSLVWKVLLRGRLWCESWTSESQPGLMWRDSHWDKHMKESMAFTVKAQQLLWVECNCYIGYISEPSGFYFSDTSYNYTKLLKYLIYLHSYRSKPVWQKRIFAFGRRFKFLIFISSCIWILLEI